MLESMVLVPMPRFYLLLMRPSCYDDDNVGSILMTTSMFNSTCYVLCYYGIRDFCGTPILLFFAG